jgi:phage terminase large subunit GpA-like protein
MKILSAVSKESAASKRQGVRILIIGTHCAKQEIYDALREVGAKPDGTLGGAHVPRCFHFPAYELPYFEGLTAEVRLTKDDGKIVWEKRGARNEPLDLAVGNLAMASLYGMDRNMYKDSWWAPLEAMVRPLAVQDETISAPPVAPVGSTPPQPQLQPLPTPNPARSTVRPVRGRFW